MCGLEEWPPIRAVARAGDSGLRLLSALLRLFTDLSAAIWGGEGAEGGARQGEPTTHRLIPVVSSLRTEIDREDNEWDRDSCLPGFWGWRDIGCWAGLLMVKVRGRVCGLASSGEARGVSALAVAIWLAGCGIRG